MKEITEDKEQKVDENQKMKEAEADELKGKKDFLDDKIKQDLKLLKEKEVETTPEPFLPPELRGAKTADAAGQKIWDMVYQRKSKIQNI